MGKSRNFKTFFLLTVLILTMVTVAACSKNTNTPAEEEKPNNEPVASANNAEGTTEVDYSKLPTANLKMTDRWLVVENQDKDPLKAELEKRLNIKLKFESPKEPGYNQALTMMLADGEMTDIVNDGYFLNDFTMKAFKEDMLTDMGAIVAKEPERYKTLNKMFNDPLWKFTNKFMFGDENKNYVMWDFWGLVSPPAGMAMYNGALINEVNGGKTPTTYDEFIAYLYNVKKAKPDVTPLSGRIDAGNNLWIMFSSLFFRTHGVDPYSIEDWNGDAKYEETATSEDAKNVWKEIAKLYADGIIEKDFLTRGSDRIPEAVGNFANGKYAVFLSNSPGAYGIGADWFVQEWKKVNPNAELGKDLMVDTQPITGPKGSANYLLPEVAIAEAATSIYVDSDAPDRALDVIDYIMSNEGQNLKWYGIQGVHYDQIKEDGTVEGFNYEKFRDEVTQIYMPGEDRQEWAPFSNLEKQMYYQIDSALDLMDAIKKGRSFGMEAAAKNNPTLAKYGEAYMAAAKLQPIYEVFAEKIWSTDENLSTIKAKVKQVQDTWYMKFIVGGPEFVESSWSKFVTELQDAGIQQLIDAKNEQAAKLKVDFENLG
ncbi:hypothetical protein [Paenibacillus mendelii]|uniref:ABC transporter substrate-binding protein n=1 Tax=Paenibacillus mendelii TaxID=206163 RepID=A0ABV6JFS9_9BACL|nr:hypothetical protein [Paenibacillus mendelii]MCQ6557652.1 hypothetical protein [Paenibacillus mendelii]